MHNRLYCICVQYIIYYTPCNKSYIASRALHHLLHPILPEAEYFAEAEAEEPQEEEGEEDGGKKKKKGKKGKKDKKEKKEKKKKKGKNKNNNAKTVSCYS